jgi:hypothetical protein
VKREEEIPMKTQALRTAIIAVCAFIEARAAIGRAGLLLK